MESCTHTVLETGGSTTCIWLIFVFLTYLLGLATHMIRNAMGMTRARDGQLELEKRFEKGT
ncbi:unnamed protein product [Thlaspi arvense]|uniref:Uncharacterized protein n=1 Tax=Thlaspi arvense TaxID=13288 RepID=A0AAU9SAJ8_THLAR|nr:unnamed protein product [Thlaspi arvense]